MVQTGQSKDATRKSTREIAKQVSMSRKKIHQIRHAHELKPHQIKRHRSGEGPAFWQRLEEIVGPCINSAENAIVLSSDEKSKVQTVERAKQILPLR